MCLRRKVQCEAVLSVVCQLGKCSLMVAGYKQMIHVLAYRLCDHQLRPETPGISGTSEAYKESRLGAGQVNASGVRNESVVA